MSGDKVIYFPDSYVVLNEEDARACSHACVLDVPNAPKEGAAQTYLYFSNHSEEMFTEDEIEDIYMLVEEIWPQFLQYRAEEYPPFPEEVLGRLWLAYTAERLEELGDIEGAKKALRLANNEPWEKLLDHAQMCAQHFKSAKEAFSRSREKRQQTLIYLVKPEANRHGFFDIYLEEDPRSNKEVYMKIIPARERRMNTIREFFHI